MTDAEPLTDADLTHLASELVVKALAVDHRYVLAIAGVPGAGKSRLAQTLVERVNDLAPAHPEGNRSASGGATPRFAVNVPMDGFHLTNAELDARGLRDRKGAPETLDADRYVALLERARDPMAEVRFPVYSRDVHDPVWPDGAVVTRGCRLVVTEGNYLLLDAPPWDRLAAVLEETWFLDTPLEQAREWIIARHVSLGEHTPESAFRWWEAVDEPNAQLVLTRSRPAGERVKYAIGSRDQAAGELLEDQ